MSFIYCLIGLLLTCILSQTYALNTHQDPQVIHSLHGEHEHPAIQAINRYNNQHYSFFSFLVTYPQGTSLRPGDHVYVGMPGRSVCGFTVRMYETLETDDEHDNRSAIALGRLLSQYNLLGVDPESNMSAKMLIARNPDRLGKCSEKLASSPYQSPTNTQQQQQQQGEEEHHHGVEQFYITSFAKHDCFDTLDTENNNVPPNNGSTSNNPTPLHSNQQQQQQPNSPSRALQHLSTKIPDEHHSTHNTHSSSDKMNQDSCRIDHSNEAMQQTTLQDFDVVLKLVTNPKSDDSTPTAVNTLSCIKLTRVSSLAAQNAAVALRFITRPRKHNHYIFYDTSDKLPHDQFPIDTTIEYPDFLWNVKLPPLLKLSPPPQPPAPQDRMIAQITHKLNNGNMVSDITTFRKVQFFFTFTGVHLRHDTFHFSFPSPEFLFDGDYSICFLNDLQVFGYRGHDDDGNFIPQQRSTYGKTRSIIIRSPYPTIIDPTVKYKIICPNAIIRAECDSIWSIIEADAERLKVQSHEKIRLNVNVNVNGNTNGNAKDLNQGSSPAMRDGDDDKADVYSPYYQHMVVMSFSSSGGTPMGVTGLPFTMSDGGYVSRDEFAKYDDYDTWREENKLLFKFTNIWAGIIAIIGIVLLISLACYFKTNCFKSCKQSSSSTQPSYHEGHNIEYIAHLLQQEQESSGEYSTSTDQNHGMGVLHLSKADQNTSVQ